MILYKESLTLRTLTFFQIARQTARTQLAFSQKLSWASWNLEENKVIAILIYIDS